MCSVIVGDASIYNQHPAIETRHYSTQTWRVAEHQSIDVIKLKHSFQVSLFRCFCASGQAAVPQGSFISRR